MGGGRHLEVRGGQDNGGGLYPYQVGRFCSPLSLPTPSPHLPLQSALRQKEAVLAEALASHSSQLEMWRAEATEVAQAASKWKQRALLLQAQVCARGAVSGEGHVTHL